MHTSQTNFYMFMKNKQPYIYWHIDKNILNLDLINNIEKTNACFMFHTCITLHY